MASTPTSEPHTTTTSDAPNRKERESSTSKTQRCFVAAESRPASASTFHPTTPQQLKHWIRKKKKKTAPFNSALHTSGCSPSRSVSKHPLTKPAHEMKPPWDCPRSPRSRRAGCSQGAMGLFSPTICSASLGLPLLARCSHRHGAISALALALGRNLHAPEFSEISGREGTGRCSAGEPGAFISHASRNSGSFPPPREHLHCQKGRCFILGDNVC